MTNFIYLVIFFVENKKNLIIKSSINLFWKFWPRKTSIDQIVFDAKIAKWTFYLYFNNKQDLYKNIIDEVFRDNLEKINILIQKIPDLKKRILTKMILSLKFFDENEIMRNIILWNNDYYFWEIDEDYINKSHLKILKLLFENNKDIDYRFISKLMRFYINIINMKPYFESEKQYNQFVNNTAWIIVNWLFSDYKAVIKDINLKI